MSTIAVRPPPRPGVQRRGHYYLDGVFFVSSVCDVCGKGPGFGMSVSHSHRRTRRRWNPNIQTVRGVVGGARRRMNVCTSCIKAGKVTRG